MNNSRHFTAALVGDPNTGKSTFFNAWTGMHQVTGNWPGVTVEKLLGEITLPTKEKLTLVDLPGIYSLHAISEDEKVAANFAIAGQYDLIINIVDAVNLERNLYLTMALMELGRPMVMVLSMTDIYARQGFSIDIDALSKRLGIPVVTADVQRKSCRAALERAVLDALATKQALVKVDYPSVLDSAMKHASREGEPAYRAIHRLEGILPGEEAEIDVFEKATGTTPDVIIADARYSKIESLIDGLIKQIGHARSEVGRSLDKIALNRWLGIPIFLGMMYLLFWFTQAVGGCFIDFFDNLGGAIFVTGSAKLLALCHSPEWLVTIVSDGLGTGVQTVMTFIPPVFFIFLGLSFLEDSGYMARAAYVMDRFMRLLGLPGSAFVPMLVGFGCTVPAIMATRTLSNRRDRLLTIFMTPFMSCGARLPVYALFGAAFFGVASGTMVFAIYMSGIVLAVLTGLLLKHTLFVGDPAPFVMELPLYHIPRPTTIFKQAWERLERFLFRAGKVLIVMVLILSVCDKIKVGSDVSVLEWTGRKISPVFTPMGVERDNWQGSVALIVGLFAKEQVVSSLNSLYALDDTTAQGKAEEEGAPAEEEEEEGVWDGIKAAFETIPENLAGLADSFLDPLGVAIFKSDYQQVLDLSQKLASVKADSAQRESLLNKIDDALDLSGLTSEVTDLHQQVASLEVQAKTNEALAPQVDATRESLEAAVAALAQATEIKSLIKDVTPANATTQLQLVQDKIEDFYKDAISEEVEADASLMATLAKKFDNDKHRAFAYLLFVLLYVPCLAAMATVVREIGWGYSTILFSYLTLLGWAVATLYYQVTVGHQGLWVTIPIVLLVATAIFFYGLGKRLKVKLVI